MRAYREDRENLELEDYYLCRMLKCLPSELDRQDAKRMLIFAGIHGEVEEAESEKSKTAAHKAKTSKPRR